VEIDPNTSSARRRSLAPADVLGRADLFAGVDAAGLAEIARAAKPCEFAVGEELFAAGAPAERLLVVVDGLVHVLAGGRVVARARHGDALGVDALVTGADHAHTLVARAPVLALALDREAWGDAVGRHPRLLRNVTEILGRRLARAASTEARRADRGEAVALVVSPVLQGTVPDVLAATAAASPRPVQGLDTQVSLQETLATLDDRLLDNGTVILTATPQQPTLALVLEHVDRAVALLASADEAVSPLLGDGVELLLADGGDRTAWPLEAGGARFARRLEAGPEGLPSAREVAWAGRHLARAKLGVALGAGGAKGFAHVGALQVLEHAGYPIDHVSGASIGAIVGTCVALGLDAAETEARLRERFTPEQVAEVFSFSLAGGSTGVEALERSLRELAGERTFADAETTLSIMSVDLDAALPAPLRDGPLWRALMAATALAGMFPPYELAGRRLVDGLALVPVPTGSVVEDGADVTLSVNLMSRDVLDAWPGDEPPPEQPEVVRKRGSRILDTLLAVMDVANLDNSVRHADAADVVVTPRFGPSTWRDFHMADLFLEAGRAAAEQQLPALTALARPQQATVPI
jgi:NTE family protein